MSKTATDHVYEIIVNANPEAVWKSLTDGQETQKYFYNGRVESDWKVGSDYHFYAPDNSVVSQGKVVEIEPHSHLKQTWVPLWIGNETSTVIWNLQPLNGTTLVKLTHTDINDAAFEQAQMHVGWIYVLSNLKSVLETGESLPPIFE
ncbi:SRPBCC domain-containing protein [Dictyobacter aurantiacus]|uniref:Activator of Hsp90 ATPase homologue 1/2-like C-terminal domain-containing protein n=1 Tax=Dictyobacter aurantiacus TaxID=1936993 RepID=A0A401ZLQ5_9CHLR|nr:SRPBCC domain-containing protein [Dictyobacter aurantiacus]GCE07706.1 hypothetical protein KDAU_50350 [Dictyobacter aurantiacus]